MRGPCLFPLTYTSEFLFILVLFSLAETGVAPQAPVITVPAN
ncbi:hypothetical protein YSA_11025 [Pseudomonas putida ND6]|uniref:Uncharacterized protein n=1 Tax=Pseudomonas putida ND6 TaxID=231023 RepID=I3V4S6_PSEPU|nr:hypothetical protein YSA_11025 [Pseudomonas putida ND6]